MKLGIIFIALLISACNGGTGNTQNTPVEKVVDTLSYSKNDLQKIKWIEGRWMGLYQGNPFYEIYRFINDSTIESLSYDWNGKDSSHSNKSYVYFKDGIYYLGDKQNWKVTSITEKEIKMLPNFEANNDVIWKYRDSSGWDAILTSRNGVTTYNMKYFDPFKK